ncbi:hypothetical protein CN107_35405, partial [Sinorhizobium meliloti]
MAVPAARGHSRRGRYGEQGQGRKAQLRQVVSFFITRALVLLSTRFCRARYDLSRDLLARRSDQVREQHSSP